MIHIEYRQHDDTESIERILQEDIAQQKKIASSVSRNKTVGRKTWFPSDVMSRKDKYNYRKSGKVVYSNMYDEIIPKEQFDSLPSDEQRNAITHWKVRHSYLAIQKAWGLNSYQWMKLMKSLHIAPVHAQANNGKKKDTSVTVPRDASPAQIVQMMSKQDIMELFPWIQQMASAKQPEQDGIHIKLNGRFDSKTASEKLLKFAQMIDGEANDFQITLTVEEVKS